MKVSEYLRHYQLTGQPPELHESREIDFWCGFLLGAVASGSKTTANLIERVELAIKLAEFIELRSK